MKLLALVRRRHGFDRALLVGLYLFCLATSAISMAYGLLGIIALLWLLSLWRQRRWREVFSAPILLPLALFLGFVLLSAVFSLHPGRSLPGLPGYLVFLLVPLVADVIGDMEEADACLNAFGLAGLALAASGLWQFAHGARGLENRMRGPLSHYMTYSGILLVIGLLHLGRALEGGGKARIFSAFVTAAAFASLLLTFTRNAYVGVLVAVLGFLAVRRPRGLLLVPVLAAAIYLVSPAGVRGRILSIADPSDPTNRDRIDMGVAGGRMIRDYPLSGLGLTLVKPYYPLYRVADSPRFRVPHLHNNPIQIAAESGLPAALSYLATVAVFFWRVLGGLRRERSPSRVALYAGSFLAIAGVTVAGLFEYNFGDTEVVMTTLVVLGLPFSRALRAQGPGVRGQGLRETPPDPRPPTPDPRRP